MSYVTHHDHNMDWSCFSGCQLGRTIPSAGEHLLNPTLHSPAVTKAQTTSRDRGLPLPHRRFSTSLLRSNDSRYRLPTLQLRGKVAPDLSGNSPLRRIYCGGLDWGTSRNSGVHIGRFITLISRDIGETLSHNFALEPRWWWVSSRRIKSSDRYPQLGN